MNIALVRPRQAWPNPGPVLRCAVLVMSMLLGALLVAPAAQAEPHEYRMECHDYVGSHAVYDVEDPTLCGGGVIHFFDTYDGRLVGKLDVFRMKTVTGPDTTLQQAYAACSQDVYCQLIVQVADAFILSKVAVVWRFLKALRAAG